MSPDPTLAELYRSFSELELRSLAADWHSLTADAQNALEAEFSSRDLTFLEPDPPLLPEYRNLTTLRQYRDLSEAIVARGALESAGIFCFLKDENLVRLDWQVSNFIGGIRLQVASSDVPQAEAILAQPAPAAFEIPDQPGFQQPRCPRCTSTDIAWQRRGRKAALLSLYLFSLPLPRGSEAWTCSSCGLRWTSDDHET